MKRYGSVIEVLPEKLEEYKELHRAVWPKVLEQIKQSNIKNYSIFLREPEMLLFSYFEYHGNDFDADMAKMAADAETQKWWEVCKPCQKILSTCKDGEHWAGMEEVFHCD